jgi:hypothetical protein
MRQAVGRKVRADYRVDLVDNRNGIVYLVDQDSGGMSVTNDAEAVVEEVAATYGAFRIFYLDTVGDVSELVHDGPRFIDYKPGDREELRRLGVVA